MRTILCILIALFFVQSVSAQGFAFKHVTDPSNVTPFADGTLSNGSHIDISQLNDSTAFVFITPDGTNGVDYANHVGIYHYAEGKWMIFNEDSNLPMALGGTFNVLVVPKSTLGVFTHTADEANTTSAPFKTFSRINNPLTDGKPNIKLLVTQRLGNQFASHNDNAPQVANTGGFGLSTPIKWYIGNNGGKTDGTDAMPMTGGGKLGATFNVLVSDKGKVPGFPITKAYSFEWTATAAYTSSAHTFINSNRPIPQNALLFVTPLWGKGQNGTEGPHNISAIAVKYNEEGKNKWSIYNANGKPMPIGSKFNVFVVLP
jgi:hypothetical protein